LTPVGGMAITDTKVTLRRLDPLLRYLVNVRTSVVNDNGLCLGHNGKVNPYKNCYQDNKPFRKYSSKTYYLRIYSELPRIINDKQHSYVQYFAAPDRLRPSSRGTKKCPKLWLERPIYIVFGDDF
jgi:hypothetical protein